MKPSEPRFPPSPGVPGHASSEGAGLAVGSLVLGILGVLTGILVVGVVPSLIGLALGVVHLRRRTERRRLATAGVVLSSLGLLVGVVALVVASSVYSQVSEMNRQMRRTPFNGWEGKLAPDLELTTLDGEVVRLSELRGRRVLLNFWASWAPGSQAEVPALVALRGEVPEESLFMLGISGEERAEIQKFANAQGINYPLARSARGGLPEPYSKIETLPTTFFLNTNGVIEHVSAGFRGLPSLRTHATGVPPKPGTAVRKR